MRNVVEWLNWNHLVQNSHQVTSIFFFLFFLLVTLVSVRVAQAELLLPDRDQGVSPAVPAQRLDLETTWQQRDRPSVKMKTSTVEIYPRLWQARGWDGASVIPQERATFSGDLNGDATCRGPQIQTAVACAQCQPGPSGVPLKAPHSWCLLQHGLQAHLLHVPNPDNSGHVVYSQKIDAHSELLGASRAANCWIAAKYCLNSSLFSSHRIPLVYNIWKNKYNKISTIFGG